MSQPIRLIRKTVWSDCLETNFGPEKKIGRKHISVWEFVGQNKFCSTKICGQKKILFRKIFGLKSFDWKTNLVGKIIWSEKNFGLRKILVRKSFWSEKNFGRKNFSRKKIWVKKNFGLRKIWVKKIVVEKKLLFWWSGKKIGKTILLNGNFFWLDIFLVRKLFGS